MSWRPPCQDFLAKNRVNMILALERDFGDNHKEAIKRGLFVQRGPEAVKDLVSRRDLD